MNAKMPKHSEITEYWIDKAITYKGEVVSLKESPLPAEADIVIMDIGEPACWCCDKPIRKVFDNKRYNKLIKTNPADIWNLRSVTSFLERAHISPRALSGNNDLSNLFLLCRDCHKASPDHEKESHFLRFIYNRRRNFIQGINRQELIDFYNILESENVDVELSDFADININSSKINTHGFDMQTSTLLSGIVDELIEKKRSD